MPPDRGENLAATVLTPMPAISGSAVILKDSLFVQGVQLGALLPHKAILA